MQCCGAIYHFVDPKIDKHRQNPQDTCSKIPGRVFSEGAEPPEAITTSRTARGDFKTGKNVNYQSTFSTFFENVDFSKSQN